MQGGEVLLTFSPAAGSADTSGAALSFPCADYIKKAHGNARVLLEKIPKKCNLLLFDFRLSLSI